MLQPFTDQVKGIIMYTLDFLKENKYKTMVYVAKQHTSLVYMYNTFPLQKYSFLSFQFAMATSIQFDYMFTVSLNHNNIEL